MALTPSPSAPIKIFDFSGNPPDPLPLGGEGGNNFKRGIQGVRLINNLSLQIS